LQGDAETPISPGYVKILSEKYWVDIGKIHVVRCGVDLDVFKEKSSTRKPFGKFTVSYSGAFSVAYDFEQIFTAAGILEKEGSGVEFVLQGKDGIESHIESQVEHLGLSNVKVINKLLERREVADLLGKADVLILPLRNFGKPYLGMSSKLYEYQALGKPIICCSYGQPSEYISETNSGIVIKPGDSEKIVEAIRYLRKNPDVAREMGTNGRRYVENHVSTTSIGLEMFTLFQALNPYAENQE
jgi:glycosyltransferase involved in cell wall biosynthesis